MLEYKKKRIRCPKCNSESVYACDMNCWYIACDDCGFQAKSRLRKDAIRLFEEGVKG